MSSADLLSPPPDWDGSDFRAFLDAARNNEFATFVRERKAWDLLESVDRVWDRWRERPSPSDLLVSTMLRARCRGAYRGALRLAVAGQCVEAFVLCRSVLEHAAYAGHAAWTPGAASAWDDRMRSDAARRTARAVFMWGPVLKGLAGRDAVIGRSVGDLYQDLIDEGAHPNPQATYGSLQIASPTTVVGPDLNLALLGPGGPQFQLALSQIFRSGVLAHEVFGCVWPDAFTGRIQDLLRNLMAFVRGDEGMVR